MKKDETKEILETVNFIKDRMATKDELRDELKLVRGEMASGLRRCCGASLLTAQKPCYNFPI